MDIRWAMLAVALATAHAPAAPGRVAVVGQTSVDFGEYPADEARTATFRIRNMGKGELRILRVRKGCGCATVDRGKPLLAPGQETDIVIKVHPGSIFGPYRKTAYVDTSDTLVPHTRLTYGGTAKPLVAVTPRQFIYAGRLPVNQRITRTFTLTPARDGVVFGEPAIRASLPVWSSLEPARDGPAGPFLLDVSFTATNHGPLRLAIDLPLTSPTNHPPIKLGVTGDFGCELVAVPAILRFPPSATPAQRRIRLRLIGPVPQVLDAAELRFPNLQGVSRELAPATAANTAELTLTFGAAFMQSLPAGEGREIAIELPDAAPATIRCVRVKN